MSARSITGDICKGVPVHIEYFTAVDVDRTVLNTSAFVEAVILPGIELYYADDKEWANDAIQDLTQQLALNIGNAFDIFAYVNQRADESGKKVVDMRTLVQRVMSKHKNEKGHLSKDFIETIMAPGSLQLLKTLEEDPMTIWGFLTTGGEQTQTSKLLVINEIMREYIGVSANAQIIGTEHKAQDIATWYDAGRDDFTIPPELTDGRQVYARHIRMIDDKRKNLQYDVHSIPKGRLLVYLAARYGVNSEPGAMSLIEVMHRIKPTQ